MKKVLFLVAGIFAACSAAPPVSVYQQQQTPVTPKGTIVGRVIDVSTYAPLEGAAVRVIGADNTSLTTNADGVFTFTGAVVASSYTFVIEKTGYVRQVRSAQLNNSSGNSPLENNVTTFSVSIYPARGEVRGTVFLPNGQPAPTAHVAIDQSNSGVGEGIVTAITAADGTFSLPGLGVAAAGVNHRVTALYYDVNGDGTADYGTTQVNVLVTPDVAARVFLTYGNIGQRIIDSNVLDSIVSTTENLDFTFALPMVPVVTTGAADNAFTLYNNTRNLYVSVEPTWSAGNTKLSLHPSSPLFDGDRYNITLTLMTEGAGNNGSPDFVWGHDFQVRAPGSTGITTQVTNLSVINASGTTYDGTTYYDWNTNDFTLSWDPVASAVQYRLYAKDTLQNPDWVYLGSVTAQAAVRNTSYAFLPSSFDVYPGNGSGQPLSGGNTVSFAVVPLDNYGSESPLSAAPTVQVRDNIPPNTNYMTNLTPVDAINDTSAPATIKFRLYYTEPMDPATKPTYITTASLTQDFVWDTAAGPVISGVLTLTLAPGADAATSFTIRGGKDTSGNALQGNDFVGSLSGYKDLSQNRSFEDAAGACSTTSWNLAASGGMSNPTTVQTSSYVGRCAALMGPTPGSAPQTGYSRLTQDVALPTLAAGQFFSVTWAARPVWANTTPTPTLVNQQCLVQTTAGVTLQGLMSYNQVDWSTYFFGTSTSVLSAQAGTTVRMMCEVNNATTTAGSDGLYVDNFAIMLVKPGSW